MKLFRYLFFCAVVMLAARPAQASPITMLIGDKDGFGLGISAGAPGTWDGSVLSASLMDNRDASESGAGNGAQLTDVYSALYFHPLGADCGNDAGAPGCSPNGNMGFVAFPISGALVSSSITMLMGDFQCDPWGAMTVDINGFDLPFCFTDGYQATEIRTFVLSPEMITAANLAGQILMTFDHRVGLPVNNIWGGSVDYIAFDYFELQADVVPEPATLGLLGAGLVWLAARRRRRA